MRDVTSIEAKLTPIAQTISDANLTAMYTSSYWNDVEAERSKEWWIADGNYDKCLRFLQTSGLIKEWSIAEKFISSFPAKGQLRVADLAAGIGWASALLSRLENVSEVHATEISRHRLTDLFPFAIDMMNGKAEKIRRHLASFYDLGCRSESLDIVFLSQAFHHADHPIKLLAEIDRVLAPGGAVVLIGENYIGPFTHFKRAIRSLTMAGRWSWNFYELFPTDPEMGDHFYRPSDYNVLFRTMGYDVRHHIVDRSLVVFANKRRL